eukprot:TRINITY_DN16150_c0_g1_i1.p1 TRINITY_DN16150_c0_g1~~TRINITY_DN16150_c0_g1_i1.p1  ORF type:complete len:614 (+),score=133.67 TRINITY_DN16150_c0_g1_i1:1414-3255(+)
MHENRLLVGMEVEINKLQRGRVAEDREDGYVVLLDDGSAELVQGENMVPVPCSSCGADLYTMRELLQRADLEKEQLTQDLERVKGVAEVRATEAVVLQEELRSVRAQLAEAQHAASSRLAEMEANLHGMVEEQVTQALLEMDEKEDDENEKRVTEAEEKARKAEIEVARPLTKLKACGDAAHACTLAARKAYQKLCEAYEQHSFFVAADNMHGGALPRLTPEFVLLVQKRRLRAISSHLSESLIQLNSAHDWTAQTCELSGRPRPADLPPQPLPLPPVVIDPELMKMMKEEEENAANDEKAAQEKEKENNLRCTAMQRYMGTPQELKVLPYTGKTHLISVCLDYKGSRSPLNCTVDGNRIVSLAAACGVKDIVKIYDDGSSELWPDRRTVVDTIRKVGARCKPGDFFVLHYSGHGGQVEDLDGDEESGFDQTLVLRKKNGETEDLVDDDLALLLAKAAHPSVGLLVLADACHSGTVMDLSKDSLWEGNRQVVSMAGCQDAQCSQDTGDGGAMTNAFLKVMKSKNCRDLRRKRRCSVQWVFNRMVESIKQPQNVNYNDSDDEEWPEDIVPDLDDTSDVDYEDILMSAIYGIDPGQDMTLSWCAGCDPTTVCFPF